MSSTSRAGIAWFLFDVAVVLIFVVIGRHTHHHGETVGGVVSTTWPFAVGLVGGWAGVLLAHRRPSSLASGVVIWLSTVAIGMVLRVIAGQGTAVAFIGVALGFLGLFVFGARVVATIRRSRRSAP
ncbi:MAG: DUF3054 domain-containing protein [Acidimicrobiales bacterium]